MNIVKLNRFCRVVFFNILFFGYLYAQDKVLIDLDFDGKKDIVKIVMSAEGFVRIKSQLSTQNFKPIFSKKLFNYDNYNLYKESKGVLKLFKKKNGYSRVGACFQYSKEDNGLILTGLSRSQDRDNSVNGAGESYLDVKKGLYLGKWSYYDYFDENPDDYRIYMPEIKAKMVFESVGLEDFSYTILEKYDKACNKLYQEQLKTFLPKGNSKNGVLYVDINDDMCADKIYYDSLTETIQSQIYDSIEDANIYKTTKIQSDKLNFLSKKYEIIQKDNIFILKSLETNEKVEFSYSDKKFWILNSNRFKKIDLDNDGKLDTIEIVWSSRDANRKSKIVCQLSSMNYKSIETDYILNVATSISDAKNGFKINFAFQRDDFSVQIRFDKRKKVLQIIGLEYFVDDVLTRNLNLLTDDFILIKEKKRFKSKAHLNFSTLEDISYKYMDNFLEVGMK